MLVGEAEVAKVTDSEAGKPFDAVNSSLQDIRHGGHTTAGGSVGKPNYNWLRLFTARDVNKNPRT